MLYSVTLTSICHVKHFIVIHYYKKKIAKAPDVSGRFASTRTAPGRALYANYALVRLPASAVAEVFDLLQLKMFLGRT